MNRFGNRFRIALWGESHGPQIGVVIDGLPAGIPLAEADFAADLARRRSGAAGTTPAGNPTGRSSRRASTGDSPRERR